MGILRVKENLGVKPESLMTLCSFSPRSPLLLAGGVWQTHRVMQNQCLWVWGGYRKPSNPAFETPKNVAWIVLGVNRQVQHVAGSVFICRSLVV